MTIPTPAILDRPASTVAVKTVIDTRCGSPLWRNDRMFVCERHGEHTRHIDCRHNVAWTDADAREGQ